MRGSLSSGFPVMMGQMSQRMLDVARELVTKLPDDDVRAAFVFGSVAWGDADETSDVDVMLLLDHDDENYREVTRVRVPDVLGRMVPEGPLFADLDRISWRRFDQVVAEGGWQHRVVRSVILVDNDGWYEQLRNRVAATFRTSDSRRQRVKYWEDQIRQHLDASKDGSVDDSSLPVLHSRLGLEAGGCALLEANGNRFSSAHFLDGVYRALAYVGMDGLFPQLLRSLRADSGAAAAEQGLRSYSAFADVLRDWVSDAELAKRLGPEDLAWATFTYAEQTYEEINHKCGAFRKAERFADLAFYVDGLLKTPIRMNTSKILNLSLTGSTERMSIPEFHLALRGHPDLFNQWVAGLRLQGDSLDIAEADELTLHLLNATQRLLKEIKDP